VTAKDPLKEKISRIILENIGDYIPGWLETLGKLGAPPKAGVKQVVDGRTRVTAAKTGMDLVSKLLPDVASGAGGQSLLEKLSRAERLTDTEPAEGGDWPTDPDLEDEKTGLGGGQEPDGSDS
jgi:hypothetical protein